MAKRLPKKVARLGPGVSLSAPAPRRVVAGFLTVLAALALIGAFPATPASAEVVEGDCDGVVTIDDEVVIDAAQPADVPVEVPRRGSFEFEGTIEREPDEDPITQRGELRLLLPIGSHTLETWSGTTSTPEVVGRGTYEVPTFAPGGSGPLPLELVITADRQRCVILVGVTVPGTTWDATTFTLLLVTVLLLAALLFSGRRDAKGKGRPLVGLLSGLLAGILAAATLFVGALIALNSVLWWVLPVVLAALGVLIGVAAPFGRDPVVPEEDGAEPDPDTTDRDTDGDTEGPEHSQEDERR